MSFPDYFICCLTFLIILKTVSGNDELSVLMEMKASLDPGGTILHSWTREGDHCNGDFEGVACNEHGSVANISLQGKGLSGKIPSSIADLNSLSGIYLHYNSLTGNIPTEFSKLTQLVDLYFNFNNLSGNIPPQIGSMTNLQVLQLCYNMLTGNIPSQIGSLKDLSVVDLKHNKLIGSIPSTLGNLAKLRSLNLGFNNLTDSIPASISRIPQLEVLDVQSNSLSGIVPQALRELNGKFEYENNPGLCGFGFRLLRNCSPMENPNDIPRAAVIQVQCNETHCSKESASKSPKIFVIIGLSITLPAALFFVVLWILIRYRRRKHNNSTSIISSANNRKERVYKRSSSPLVRLEYSNGWDPFSDGQNCSGFSQEFLKNYRFNLDEVESASRNFSDANLLGKTKFSTVYKGTMRDGSLVAIKSFNATNCKASESEFADGLNLLTSLRHENLVRLRGFCCSRGRGECFLVYDFATNGNLSKYLDARDKGRWFLDWPTRVSIINGIAQGIEYLHSTDASKPALTHQNIAAEKILLGKNFNPLISDSGLPKILTNDVIFSMLIASAAMGYLAPEYAITGRFTDKSDIYAFGIIVLQMLSGTQMLSSSARASAESCNFAELIDENLEGNFLEFEAKWLAKIAVNCTHQLPLQRPTIGEVIQELGKCGARKS